MAKIATKITSAYDGRPQVPGLIGRESSIAQPHKLALNRLRVEGRHEPEGLERNGL